MIVAMNSAVPGTPAAAAAPLEAGVVAADPATADAMGAQAAPLLPFQQWIGLDPAVSDKGAPLTAARADEEAPDTAQQITDAPLLAAMNAPLLPTTAPAALPAMMMAMPGARRDSGDVKPQRDDAMASIAPASARPVRSVADSALVAPLPAPMSAPATPTLAQTPLAGDPATFDIKPDSDVNTGVGVGVAAAQPTSARAPDTVTLAGAPASWRQSLHEALGQRLQLQAGRGIEQATIRLEPPQLGRIEIAIRHSGGNLEVHIAASNGDVLRQLQSVSESLRNDLGARQYASVSLNVSETPRAQATAQAGNHPGQGQGDQQGRSRQQDQQQARAPGQALHDGGDGATLFSMNGRD